MIRFALFVICCLAAPVVAQDALTEARSAAQQIRSASQGLEAADGARNRVAALTETIRAFESGLASLREGLRGAAIRETELTRSLHARETDTAQLMGALQVIGRTQGPTTTLHPDGPLGTARAGMIVASLTPGLAAKAEQLRADLNEVIALRELQQEAAQLLQDGLTGVQNARFALSQAMTDRTDLPRRFSADPVRTAILISAAETLDAFANGLSKISETDILPTDVSIDARKGALPLPVAGQVLRRAGEADAAGVKRPGVVLATRPQALVITPVSATIRYRGPLLNYGLVTILEPQPDLLFVFAGLDTVYGEIGEVLPEGSPVGLMGGETVAEPTGLSQSSERGGAVRSETLYIEVRQGATPVDPMTWFDTDKG